MFRFNRTVTSYQSEFGPEFSTLTPLQEDFFSRIPSPGIVVKHPLTSILYKSKYLSPFTKPGSQSLELPFSDLLILLLETSSPDTYSDTLTLVSHF